MKNGFTLVELLAVIVILAVLALIATPVVLSIIDDAKESAMLRSAEMYLSGVENAVMRENMNSGGNFRPNECTITNGNMTCESTNVEVEVDGEVPNDGSIIFENGKIKEVTLNYESGTIVKDSSGNLVYEGENGSGSKENLSVAGLYAKDGTFVRWSDLLNTNYKLGEHEHLGASDEDRVMVDHVLEISINGEGFLYLSLNCINYSAYCLNGYTELAPNQYERIIIDDSVEKIGYIDFYNLSELYIPKSVTELMVGSISIASYVKTLYYEGTEEEWNAISGMTEHSFSYDNIVFNYKIQ